MRLARVEIQGVEQHFSAGHFTIFSATEREDLHGHNYNVALMLEVILNENGLTFDYRYFKQKLKKLCAELDRRFLLPSQSKYLKLKDEGDMWIAEFAAERIPFLKRDVLILPISNVTIEELSQWFLAQLAEDRAHLTTFAIQRMEVKVFNGPNQAGVAELIL